MSPRSFFTLISLQITAVHWLLYSWSGAFLLANFNPSQRSTNYAAAAATTATTTTTTTICQGDNLSVDDEFTRHSSKHPLTERHKQNLGGHSNEADHQVADGEIQ